MYNMFRADEPNNWKPTLNRWCEQSGEDYVIASRTGIQNDFEWSDVRGRLKIRSQYLLIF